jgi:hypothetical protein
LRCSSAEADTVRLLVLDHSGILPWLVEHAAPPGVDVEAVTSLQQAERALRDHPPDAAVVSVPHGTLPWREFQHLCATLQPPVPVLYESCIHAAADDVGIEPGEGVALFLRKPAPRGALHAALAELLACVAEAAGSHLH